MMMMAFFPQGRLCSQCLCPYRHPNGTASDESCYFSSNGQCLRCSEIETIAISTTVAVCILAALVLWALLIIRWPKVYRSLLDKVNSISNSGTFKIALVWIQITITINGGWPTWVLDETGVIKWLRLTNLSTTGIGLECIANWLSDPRWNLLMYLMLPPAITLFLFVAVCLRLSITRMWTGLAHHHRYRSALLLDSPTTKSPAELSLGSLNADQASEPAMDSSVPLLQASPPQSEDMTSESRWQPNAWEWGRYMWLWSLYFLFFGLAHRTFDVFSCIEEPVTGELYLASQPWLSCSTYASFDGQVELLRAMAH